MPKYARYACALSLIAFGFWELYHGNIYLATVTLLIGASGFFVVTDPGCDGNCRNDGAGKS